jgi:hypothetical protein
MWMHNRCVCVVRIHLAQCNTLPFASCALGSGVIVYSQTAANGTLLAIACRSLLATSTPSCSPVMEVFFRGVIIHKDNLEHAVSNRECLLLVEHQSLRFAPQLLTPDTFHCSFLSSNSSLVALSYTC